MDRTTQQAHAETFRALHRGTEPLVLFNVWDVASGVAVAKHYPAIATSSWAVAAAQGFADREHFPFEEVLRYVGRLTAAVPLPVTVDLENGYGEAPEAAAKSVTAVIEAGAIGINLEDGQGQVTRSMAEPARQAAKIKAVRAAAEAAGIKLFINARTDVFLQKPASLAAGLAEAERRGKVYAEAGADSLFVPGLADLGGIADMVKRTTLPLNIMATNQVPEIPDLAKAGVKRVSLGAWPCVAAMRVLGEAAAATAKTKLYGSYLKP